MCVHFSLSCDLLEQILTVSCWEKLNRNQSPDLGFPGGTSAKEPACQCRRHKRREFDPWVGKIPWRWAWQPTPYSCLENPMDRGPWQATVHGVAESRTQLSDLAQSASGVSIHTGAGRLSHEGLSPLLWISSPGWHARPKPKQACHSIGSILH